jgi:hypothetical protein
LEKENQPRRRSNYEHGWFVASRNPDKSCFFRLFLAHLHLNRKNGNEKGRGSGQGLLVLVEMCYTYNGLIYKIKIKLYVYEKIRSQNRAARQEKSAFFHCFAGRGVYRVLRDRFTAVFAGA